jgi:hypothetical protein
LRGLLLLLLGFTWRLCLCHELRRATLGAGSSARKLRRRQRGCGKQQKSKFGHGDLDPGMSFGAKAFGEGAAMNDRHWAGLWRRSDAKLDSFFNGKVRARIVYFRISQGLKSPLASPLAHSWALLHQHKRFRPY